MHTKFNRAGGKNKRGGARSDAGRPKKEEAEAEAAKSDVDMFDDAEHAEHGEDDEDADLSRRLPFFFVFAVFIEVTCGSGINHPPPVAINKKNLYCCLWTNKLALSKLQCGVCIMLKYYKNILNITSSF